VIDEITRKTALLIFGERSYVTLLSTTGLEKRRKKIMIRLLEMKVITRLK